MPKLDNLVALHHQMTGSYVVDAPPLVTNPLDWWALNLIEGLQRDRERLIAALEQTTSELLDEIRVKYSEDDLKYPSMQRSYRADIAQVEKNHKLLKELRS
ncbi:hypothetical protein MLC59_01865 [Marinobacter bryozoorum]|uniref:hypothetical protein n=1 Tax=Marinobacter bryozoorum TaxID=256324 RepID=UPI0020052792|nr:hypothetical protein [Marinobacter bryozoorum]MCK7542916.1 hypothetical protein [Marinobacter bryozoorum]